jgi:hypothetical protein
VDPIVPVDSAFGWVDHSISFIFGKQRYDGIIEGWHGDANSKIKLGDAPPLISDGTALFEYPLTLRPNEPLRLTVRAYQDLLPINCEP